MKLPNNPPSMSITSSRLFINLPNNPSIDSTKPCRSLGSANGRSSRLEVSFTFTDDKGGDGGGKRKGPSEGGGGDDDGGDHEEEDQFGPLLKFEQVIKEAEARGVSLPSDMMEAAKNVGIRKMFLMRYLDLQGSVSPLCVAMKSCSMLRNRMLADPTYLFKIGVEILIDSGCATFAEVKKRSKDFRPELLYGVVANVALVGLLAPYVRIGQPSLSKEFLRRLQHSYTALSSRLTFLPATIGSILPSLKEMVSLLFNQRSEGNRVAGSPNPTTQVHFEDEASSPNSSLINSYVLLQGGWPLRECARGVIKSVDPSDRLGGRLVGSRNYVVYIDLNHMIRLQLLSQNLVRDLSFGLNC
ncbi:hypothetical protein ACHQM5_020135 [Ranunculus cassubicifolius]